jgi:hypothetical protein
MSRDKSGRYWIVDGGCIRNPLKTAYKRMTINTFPAWNPGFVVIKDGVPILISEESFGVISRLF